jgi:hypothetical protein
MRGALQEKREEKRREREREMCGGVLFASDSYDSLT